MARLPEEQKQVLALAYFQGLTHSQMAQVLGVPLGTVKTRIRLGMQKLREMLPEDQGAG
jgi:RNA polymerase sigma-70 factor (ECF subfamily)